MAASVPYRSTGWRVRLAASSGWAMASRMLPGPRAARYSGRDRPAWRMNQTGTCPTSRPRQARMNGASSKRPGGWVVHVIEPPPALSGVHGTERTGAGPPVDGGSTGFDHRLSLRERAVTGVPGHRSTVAAGRGHTIEGSPGQVGARRTEVGVEAERQAEQEFVDTAYARLDAMRSDATSMMEGVLDLGRGGTFQSRTERDVIVRTSLARLEQLDIGDQALTFGRIDRIRDDPARVGWSATPRPGCARRQRLGPFRRRLRRPRPTPSPSTSAGWPSTVPTTIPWWWTGAPRSPSRSTGPRAATPRAWCSGATWPWRAVGWSGSRTSGSGPPGPTTPRWARAPTPTAPTAASSS